MIKEIFEKGLESQKIIVDLNKDKEDKEITDRWTDFMSGDIEE